MRKHRIVLGLALSLGGVVLFQAPAFSQQHGGTLDQQIACTPDVFRVCSEQIPDENRIVACLRQNVLQLSAPCRAVFEPNNSVPQAQAVAPRRRNGPVMRPYDDDDQ